jgi:hypothetical protein
MSHAIPATDARKGSVTIMIYQRFQGLLPATPDLMYRFIIWVVAIHQIWCCGTSNMTRQLPQI